MTQDPKDVFENSELLVKAMGRWPSFHDAEVKEVTREQSDLRVQIHVFEMTNQVDSKGYYVLAKHHLVTLQMSRIVESTLPGDYEGDIMFGLSAERLNGVVRVEFISVIDGNRSYHVDCEVASVLSVVQFVGNH